MIGAWRRWRIRVWESRVLEAQSLVKSFNKNNWIDEGQYTTLATAENLAKRHAEAVATVERLRSLEGVPKAQALP